MASIPETSRIVSSPLGDRLTDYGVRALARQSELERQLASAQDQLEAAYAEIERRGAEVEALRHSLSWRLTSPFRAVIERLVFRTFPIERATTRTTESNPVLFDTTASSAETPSGVEPGPTPGSEPHGVPPAPALPQPCHGFLVISDRVPTPDRDSGSVRLSQLMKLLARQADVVTFLANEEGDNDLEPYLEDLRDAGVAVFRGRTRALEHLERCGRYYRYVLLSRPDVAFSYLFHVRAHAIHATVVYDTVDLHWVRLSREADVTGHAEAGRQASQYLRIERFNTESSDLVLTISEEERRRVLADTNTRRCEVLPNIHSGSDSTATWEARSGLLFVGGFWHAPNVDAVLYFVHEILPEIRIQLPDIVLTVIGSNMPHSIQELDSPFVRCLGYVADLRPHLEHSRVSVVPLRYGAGMKGKVGESMSHGVPVVTTTIGSEGLDLTQGETAMIADDSESFVEAVVRLHQDEGLWQRLSKQSQAHIRERFSPAAVASRIDQLFPRLT